MDPLRSAWFRGCAGAVLPFLLTVVLSLCFQEALAREPAGDAITVSEGTLITAHITDVPLGEVLAAISQKVPIEVKGRWIRTRGSPSKDWPDHHRVEAQRLKPCATPW